MYNVGQKFKELCKGLDIEPTVEDAHRLFKETAAKEAVNSPPEPLLADYEPKDDSCTVYCLKLKDDFYYVGKSKNANTVHHRIRRHEKGGASMWTDQHQMVETIFIKNNMSPFQEDLETIRAMALYGVDKVRGGSFSKPELSAAHIHVAKEMIAGATDACFACGERGHYMAVCEAR